MRNLTSVLLLIVLGVHPRFAAAGEPQTPFDGDPLLDRLVGEALEKKPEYAQARSVVAADRERVPQAGALPDPTLTLGIQNDGFSSIQVGKMETSFYQIAVTQPLYWPGKRGLRTGIASRQVSVAEAQLERVRLGVEADVRRGYLDLLLVRDQLRLLERLEALWKQSEGLARARYTVGEGPQSDLLRAQLERTRLQQQRWALELSERNRVQELNRLRSRPLDEPIATTRRLVDLADPAQPKIEDAHAGADERSPELKQARVSVRLADERSALARRERYPDFAVSAGVMPRGSLDPMWALSVSVGLPIWSGRKQGRAVAESEALEQGEKQGEESIRQVLRLRTEERAVQLETALKQNQLYRQMLLVQSDAAVESTMSQYKVGRVTFASVLEALSGYLADQAGYLESIVQAQRLAIAELELSLDPSEVGGGLAVRKVPGASMGGARAKGGASAPAEAPASGGAPSGTSGGM
jgi:outer membrane protein TolC